MVDAFLLQENVVFFLGENVVEHAFVESVQDDDLGEATDELGKKSYARRKPTTLRYIIDCEAKASEVRRPTVALNVARLGELEQFVQLAHLLHFVVFRVPLLKTHQVAARNFRCRRRRLHSWLIFFRFRLFQLFHFTEAQTFFVSSFGNFFVQARESAGRDEEDVGGVDVDRLAVAMRRSTRSHRNAHHGALQDLEQTLLHAFTSHVTVGREGRLPRDLIHFVQINNACTKPLSCKAVVTANLRV